MKKTGLDEREEEEEGIIVKLFQFLQRRSLCLFNLKYRPNTIILNYNTFNL